MNTSLWFSATDMKTHNYNTKKKILKEFVKNNPGI